MDPNEKALPEWRELVELLKPAGEVNDITLAPEDDQLRMELYRQFVMNMALGYFIYFQTDPRFPDWIPFLNSAFLLQPNPDDVYHVAKVEDSGVYRISGNRGTVHLLIFSTGADIMGTTDQVGGANTVFDADDLHIADDGSFDVILSASRPQGHSGDWWELKKGMKSILSRQRSYDWAGELSARFAIERLDVPPGELRPRPSAGETAAKLRDVMLYTERLSRMWISYQNQIIDKLGANQFEITGFNGAMSMQAYLQGIYRFQPDEAVILETDVPDCRYWNFQINDALWNQVDYVYRQSSLNGHQAKLDSDGKFRAVISVADPGVYNWLDTGGFTEGMIIGRWLGTASHPLPRLTRVKLSEVKDHLLQDAPTVSVEERHQQIRQRTLGSQLRRRW